MKSAVFSGSGTSGTVIPASPLGFTPVMMMAMGRGTDPGDDGEVSFVGFSTGLSATKGTTVFYPASVPGPETKYNPDSLYAATINFGVKLEVVQFDSGGVAVQWESFSGLSSFSMSAVVIGY
jgi:hypothetical protein